MRGEEQSWTGGNEVKKGEREELGELGKEMKG